MNQEMLTKFLEYLVADEKRLMRQIDTTREGPDDKGDLMEVRRFMYLTQDILAGRQVA
jgi:hypothetical protein